MGESKKMTKRLCACQWCHRWDGTIRRHWGQDGGGGGENTWPKCCVHKKNFNFIQFQKFYPAILQLYQSRHKVTKNVPGVTLSCMYMASTLRTRIWYLIDESMAMTLRPLPRNVRMLYQNFISSNITLIHSLPCFSKVFETLSVYLQVLTEYTNWQGLRNINVESEYIKWAQN